jgi:hypothetical protein
MSDMDNEINDIIQAARILHIIEYTVEGYEVELANIHDKVFYTVFADVLSMHKERCMQHSEQCEKRLHSYVLGNFNDYYYKYMTSKEL